MCSWVAGLPWAILKISPLFLSAQDTLVKTVVHLLHRLRRRSKSDLVIKKIEKGCKKLIAAI